MTNTCKIKGTHCESCGSTSPEDVGLQAARENDGYSACCNELIVDPGFGGCRNHHGAK